MDDNYKNRRLIPVPENQKDFIRTTCQRDFIWWEEAHGIWKMMMNIACGINERFLPCGNEYDFDTTLHLFRTQGNVVDGDKLHDSHKVFGYMQDSLNCLLGEVLQKEYYELAENIKSMMLVLEDIIRHKSHVSDGKSA